MTDGFIDMKYIKKITYVFHIRFVNTPFTPKSIVVRNRSATDTRDVRRCCIDVGHGSQHMLVSLHQRTTCVHYAAQKHFLVSEKLKIRSKKQ